jgi:EpsI family protein
VTSEAFRSFMTHYWHEHRAGLSVALVLAASLGFCYGPVITSLVVQWRDNDIYAHGFLIPWISLYLAWMRRGEIARLRLAPNYIAGLLALLFSLFVLVASERAAVSVVAQLSLVFTLAALVLLACGVRALQLFWLPIAYLIFMIPVWETLTDPIHYPFQIFSADAGLQLIRGLGIPAYREGTYIVLPNITLEVARVCSGVNYLIAIVAIGIPLAWIGLTGVLRRTVFLMTALAIAVAANGLRVGTIGVLAHAGFNGPIHGPGHVLQGLAVATVGYAALGLGLWALQLRQRRPARDGASLALDIASVAPLKITRALLVASLLLLLGGTAVRFYPSRSVPMASQWHDFPNVVGPWVGRPSATSTMPLLEADQSLLRTYSDDRGNIVHLYVGYFESQRQGKELVSYKTKDLEMGRVVPVDLGEGPVMHVKERYESIGPSRELVSHWFAVNGRITTDRFHVKLYTAFESIFLNRTDGALVLITVPESTDEDLKTLQQRRDRFIGAVWPKLAAFLPN